MTSLSFRHLGPFKEDPNVNDPKLDSDGDEESECGDEINDFDVFDE